MTNVPNASGGGLQQKWPPITVEEANAISALSDHGPHECAAPFCWTTIIERIGLWLGYPKVTFQSC